MSADVLAAARSADGAERTPMTLKMHLSPAYLNDPMAGIYEQLNRSLLRYVERLQGVLLGFHDVRLKGSHGTILTDAPHVHFVVSFDAVRRRLGLATFSCHHIGLATPQLRALGWT